MKTEKRNIYSMIVHGEKIFFSSVILLEMITYTFSFLISGLAKKDIFNLLEGKRVTLGIYSLWILILLNTAIPLLINGVKQLNAELVAKLETRLRKNVKLYLFETVLSEKLGMERVRGYGENVSLFRNECDDLSAYMMEYYYQLPKIVLSVAILVVMICINPLFAIISLVPTFGMVIFTKYLGKHIVANREAARKSTSRITEFMENLFGNIEYFKLAADGERLCEIFSEKCRIRSKNEIRDRVLDKALSAFSENSASMVMGIVLILGIPLYRRGVFSVGEFVMFEYYYVFLASLPDAVGKLVRRYKQSKVSIARLQAEQRECYAGNAEAKQNELKLEVEYGQKKIAVKAHRGEVILIQSELESERSLALQRLFQICKEKLPEISCQYVPQQPVLFQDNVLNNICFGKSFEEERMNLVLQKTDLIEDIREFESGIYKNVGKQGTMVSGGQKKRIGIARALYQGAEVLFIDGLSEAVDKRTEQILISNVLSQAEGIIFVASRSEGVKEKAAQIIRI